MSLFTKLFNSEKEKTPQSESLQGDVNSVKTAAYVPAANKEKKKDSFFTKIKKIKHFEFIVAGLAVVIMLVVYFVSFNSGSTTSNSTTGHASTTTYSDYCSDLQKQLQEAVSNVKGAGKAEVVINFESSVEYIIAYSTSGNTSNGNTSTTSTVQLVTKNGVTEPIILKEIYPKVLGVLIVVTNGDDAKVKSNIINAVATFLDITANKVVVLARQAK